MRSSTASLLPAQEPSRTPWNPLFENSFRKALAYVKNFIWRLNFDAWWDSNILAKGRSRMVGHPTGECGVWQKFSTPGIMNFKNFQTAMCLKLSFEAHEFWRKWTSFLILRAFLLSSMVLLFLYTTFIQTTLTFYYSASKKLLLSVVIDGNQIVVETGQKLTG